MELLLSLLLVTFASPQLSAEASSLGGVVVSQQPASLPAYEDALVLANKTDRPLVVIVGAKWCNPCQRAKSEALKIDQADAVVTYVDVDDQRGLAAKLMDNSGKVPQIIVFKKREGSWRKLTTVGYQTKDRILEIVRRK